MRRISLKKIVAKDPLKDQDLKMEKLISLMKKYGFKIKQKNRTVAQQKYGLMQYSLTIFGQLANIVVTRNSGAIGSNSPLKILVYIPSYDGMCVDWNKYFKGIQKINNFIEDAKSIDQNFII